MLTAEDSKNYATSHRLLFTYRSLILVIYGGIFLAARIAIQNGAAGIIVSNHGARQLDYVPATISALEEVHDLFMAYHVFCIQLCKSSSLASSSFGASVVKTSGCQSSTRACACVLGWRSPTWY